MNFHNYKVEERQRVLCISASDGMFLIIMLKHF